MQLVQLVEEVDPADRIIPRLVHVPGAQDIRFPFMVPGEHPIHVVGSQVDQASEVDSRIRPQDGPDQVVTGVDLRLPVDVAGDGVADLVPYHEGQGVLAGGFRDQPFEEVDVCPARAEGVHLLVHQDMGDPGVPVVVGDAGRYTAHDPVRHEAGMPFTVLPLDLGVVLLRPLPGSLESFRGPSKGRRKRRSPPLTEQAKSPGRRLKDKAG